MSVETTETDGLLPFLEIRPPGHPTMVYRDLAASP